MVTLEEDNENEEAEEDMWRTKLIVAQMRDKNVKELKDQIASGQKKGYEVRDGIVYRKDGEKLQLLIPENMIPSVIFHMHDNMGHMGEDKTSRNIRRHFFFANMRQLVKDHIENCLPCLTFNAKSGRKEQKLKIYEKIPLPFSTVHIDHLGPLEKSKKGYQHILVIVDAFTKYVRLYATKTTNTKEVLRSLNDYCRSYGIPKRIVSDRGTAFSSEEFKTWVGRKGNKHVMIATACPRANGQVERFNRTLVPLLAKKADKEKKDWSNLLEKAEFVLNNMTSSATGDTPARLLFGVDQNKGEEMEAEEWMRLLNGDVEPTLEERRQNAKRRIDEVQKYNKEYYDKGVVKEKIFCENDLVMLKGRAVVGQKSKLYGKFKGPYQVVKVLEKERYLVADIPGKQVGRKPYEAIVDTTRMKKYSIPEKSRPRIEDSCDDDLDAENDSEVEEIS